MIITCFWSVLNGLRSTFTDIVRFSSHSTCKIGRCHLVLQLGKLASSNLPRVAKLKPSPWSSPLHLHALRAPRSLRGSRSQAQLSLPQCCTLVVLPQQQQAQTGPRSAGRGAQSAGVEGSSEGRRVQNLTPIFLLG